MKPPTLKERIFQKSKRHWREYPGSARFWENLRADLHREKPRHPTPEAIRKGLASGRPVPEWAADYIAGRLAGTIKLPRGVPTWSEVGLNAGECAQLRNSSLQATALRAFHSSVADDIYLRKLLYKRGEWRIGKSSDLGRDAAALVSKHTDVPVDTIWNEWSFRFLVEIVDKVTEGQSPPHGMIYNAYPDALAAESRHRGIPERTLDRWYRSRFRT